MKIKTPLKIDHENEEINSIIEKIQFSIEQHPSQNRVLKEK